MTRAEASGVWRDNGLGCKGQAGWLVAELAEARAFRILRMEEKTLNMIVSPMGVTTEILYDR
ncbi:MULTISPECIES: hypothetical protein [Methylocaldum]|uniref:hypothetical protein n=1 Tax=unclassified Methylocaldum TaxID=2622260 RepID=UPI000A3240D6|nr:hypothetical protein [Methylocaldum sp. BRCS4]